MTSTPTSDSIDTPVSVPDGQDVTRLRDLSPQQWKCGIAAWLGWLFDGLDTSLYILVALPYVASLLATKVQDPAVSRHASYIQAAFLVGWAIGGAVFGRIGDRYGRSRTISLTILTYAIFTGFQGLAWSWTALMLFRFLSALGIGGEWAAGSSLVSETWPKKWRPWVSATLQSAYQGGFLLASLTGIALAHANPRWVFAVGVVPALIIFWIRRNIPEPTEWHEAQKEQRQLPAISDLFKGEVRRITILTIILCSAALTTVWALIFWYTLQLRHLPDVAIMSPAEQTDYISKAQIVCFIVAIGGNFFAAAVARYFGYRKATFVMFLGGAITMYLAYGFPHDHIQIIFFASLAHFFVQGVFGLFPLYIPPLFPTLLRTTGAGFCYNVGRLVAAAGTIIFGLSVKLTTVADFNQALVWVGLLYIPALLITFFIPEPSDVDRRVPRGGSVPA